MLNEDNAWARRKFRLGFGPHGNELDGGLDSYYGQMQRRRKGSADEEKGKVIVRQVEAIAERTFDWLPKKGEWVKHGANALIGCARTTELDCRWQWHSRQYRVA